jgi:site-specific DNA-methyltransferase (cytosine-N4-specific)
MLIKCKLKSYIQPFEKELALNELASISNSQPKPLLTPPNLQPLEYQIISEIPATKIAENLTYWEYILTENKYYFTTQVLRESTVNILRSDIPPEKTVKEIVFRGETSLPNRRCLRYGTHGIHEYRGKFFPQLVRSLITISQVPNDGIVADPMSGSGTTICEAVLANRQGIGLDLNPLSVLIGKTKCSLLSVKSQDIISAYQYVYDKLSSLTYSGISTGLPYFSSLPAINQKYLSDWFFPAVLYELDQIALLVHSLEDQPIKNLMILALSNIIRSVSRQKESDLRVRKDKDITEDTNIEPIQEFLKELERSVKTIVAFLYQNQESKLGTFNIENGNARQLSTIWQQWLNKVDVVITSPPYATALPYLDTDRLSLGYLGLLSRSELRKLDKQMIGNREISEKERLTYWNLFQENNNILPESVVNIINKIHSLNYHYQEKIGCRKKNLPSLLAKYFFDMRDVLQGIYKLLKPEGTAYIVVGSNHTNAANQRIDIDTPMVLFQKLANQNP